MIRMARVYDVPDEMFREKQRILEYFLGVQLQEGDVLYSKMYGARLWPAIFSDWNILTVPLQITRKHKDALRFFCLVTLQLEKRSMCTFLTLRNDDDGIVDCFGSIDSRVESVIYKTMVHFYRNKLEIRVNKIFEETWLVPKTLERHDLSGGVSGYVERCLSPVCAIVFGLLHDAEEEYETCVYDFLTEYTVYPLYSGFDGIPAPKTLEIFSGTNKTCVDVTQFVSLWYWNTNCIEVDFLKKIQNDPLVKVLAISKLENQFEESISTHSAPYTVVLNERIADDVNGREISRHATVLDVCLTLGSLEKMWDNTLLWILRLLPLMDFWTDYKIMQLITRVRKSMCAVREARRSEIKIAKLS